MRAVGTAEAVRGRRAARSGRLGVEPLPLDRVEARVPTALLPAARRSSGLLASRGLAPAAPPLPARARADGAAGAPPRARGRRDARVPHGALHRGGRSRNGHARAERRLVCGVGQVRRAATAAAGAWSTHGGPQGVGITAHMQRPFPARVCLLIPEAELSGAGEAAAALTAARCAAALSTPPRHAASHYATLPTSPPHVGGPTPEPLGHHLRIHSCGSAAPRVRRAAPPP